MNTASRISNLVHIRLRSVSILFLLILAGACKKDPPPPAPTNLSYGGPFRVVIGSTATIAPAITGTPTSYTVTPTLPAGLTINAKTGVISGTPATVFSESSYTVTASNESGATTTSLSVTMHPLAPHTLRLQATATDADGDAVTLRWRTTDGRLDSTSGASVQWTLPEGGGLHFAYALASDGRGGYAVERIAVSTDDIGTTNSVIGGTPLSAPAKPDAPGAILTTRIRGRAQFGEAPYFSPPERMVYMPGVLARAYDFDTGRRTATAISDSEGLLTIPRQPLANYTLECSIDSGASFFDCGSSDNLNSFEEGMAPDHYIGTIIEPWFSNIDSGLQMFGRALQADGQRCGIRDHFFGVDVTATVSMLNQAGTTQLTTPVAANLNGEYSFFTKVSTTNRPYAARIRAQCESSTTEKAITLPVSRDVTLPEADQSFEDLTFANRRPVFGSIRASLNGVVIATSPAATSTARPSDNLQYKEQYLAYKGLDTRAGACSYYRSIGAIERCNTDGSFVSPITFDAWKRQHKLAPYNASAEYTAAYVNQVDLNLTRIQHGTRVDANHIAYYVCNHLGPKDDSQTEIDLAIDNARKGRNLIACVAMDYSVNSGVNGDRPYIKYLIFGPSGELLPSINLDGRREKFVPGVCVSCHGGDHYAGPYPSDGSEVANVGAHFLPYDIDNFAFSSASGLRKADQLAQIRQLNLLLLQATPAPSLRSLIQGWYPGGSEAPDENYVPATWTAAGPQATAVYRGFIKPYCRTCHIAFSGEFDFEIHDNYDNAARNYDSVCGTGEHPHRNRSMPNSLVTFDRLFATQGTANDALKLMVDYLNRNSTPPLYSGCTFGGDQTWPTH